MTLIPFKRFRRLPVALSLAVLGGCASMSQEECAMANWREIGFEDGLKGRAASNISNHRKACASYNVQPDFQQYTQGHNEGVKQYCQPENAYQQGLNGKAYNGICPANLSGTFMPAYQQGKAIHSQRMTITSLDIENSSLHHKIDRMNKAIREDEAALVSDGLNSSQRSALLGKIRELNRKIGEINGQITVNTRQAAAADVRLQQMLKHAPYA